MKQQRVVRKRIITVNGQVIAEASSVIITNDQAEENTTFQQHVDVEVFPKHTFAQQISCNASSHVSHHTGNYSSSHTSSHSAVMQ